MDQKKIGRFIAECRKMKKLTQEELAEKLNVSDRAVSKWERGINMPDASLMLGLSSFLGISVNELLCGERLESKKYIDKAEENLVKLKEIEEEKNRMLLMLEVVIGLICTFVFEGLILTVTMFKLPKLPTIILVIIACLQFALGLFFAMKLEREVGYYECGECHHKYIPETFSFLFSMHSMRNRFLKCPKCGKRSWSKKVLTK